MIGATQLPAERGFTVSFVIAAVLLAISALVALAIPGLASGGAPEPTEAATEASVA